MHNWQNSGPTSCATACAAGRWPRIGVKWDTMRSVAARCGLAFAAGGVPVEEITRGTAMNRRSFLEASAAWSVAAAGASPIGRCAEAMHVGEPAAARAPQEPPQYQWASVTERAAFAARDGAGALVFKGRMWLLGGWNPKVFPRKCSSEIW